MYADQRYEFSEILHTSTSGMFSSAIQFNLNLELPWQTFDLILYNIFGFLSVPGWKKTHSMKYILSKAVIT